MVLRWLKRAVWGGLLVVLVVLPARLAHSPESAQGQVGAGVTDITPPGDPGVGPVGWLILVGTLLVLPAYLMLRPRWYRR